MRRWYAHVHTGWIVRCEMAILAGNKLRSYGKIRNKYGNWIRTKLGEKHDSSSCFPERAIRSPARPGIQTMSGYAELGFWLHPLNRDMFASCEMREGKREDTPRPSPPTIGW